MKLVKEKINKTFEDNSPEFVVFDETSKMYYKKPTWTYCKYTATRMTSAVADAEIEAINDMNEKFMKSW